MIATLRQLVSRSGACGLAVALLSAGCAGEAHDATSAYWSAGPIGWNDERGNRWPYFGKQPLVLAELADGGKISLLWADEGLYVRMHQPPQRRCVIFEARSSDRDASPLVQIQWDVTAAPTFRADIVPDLRTSMPPRDPVPLEPPRWRSNRTDVFLSWRAFAYSKAPRGRIKIAAYASPERAPQAGLLHQKPARFYIDRIRHNLPAP